MWSRHTDLVAAFAVLMIIGVMLIKMPTGLLSFFLAANLGVSILILLLTMYTQEPLQFSVFPSLLLITTLFRLALNVSSTRLILLQGDAGAVISGFGNFVVGGEPVVGFVVFVILVIIQFIVITKGAERVAEVAARFTLDAMPGKQMSIDADLNSGLITEDEARQRRRAIQQEADFYGAMDGASKFVKGDAIAGILTVIINLIGGFAIGVWRDGGDVMSVLQHYSLLTVGDGLVTQIPALLISTATGIIVTRAASDRNMGQDVSRQMLAQPRVLYISGGVIALLGLVAPGLPALPFLLVGGMLGGLGYLAAYGQTPEPAAVEASAAADPGAQPADGTGPEAVAALLAVDPLELELGYALLPLADQSGGGDLMDRIVAIRRQMAVELGIVLPYIRVRDNIQLKPTQYAVKLRGVDAGQGEVFPDHYLAMNPGGATEHVPGIETVEPAFGLPALWVQAGHKERAELAGYTVVDPAAVIATHLTEIVRQNAAELLGRQEVQALLDTVRQSHPAVVQELVPDVLTVGEVQKVLQNLLREHVSIRDLVTVLEALADHGRYTRDPDVLTEYARQALRRSIAQQYRLQDGRLPVITLHPDIERQLEEVAQQREAGDAAQLSPEFLQKLLSSLTEHAGKAAAQGHLAIVVTTPTVRPLFRRLTQAAMPRLVVLSYQELMADSELEVVGMVTAS